MDILIRKATTTDLDLVTHIEATCFPPAEAAPREAFKERLDHYAGQFLIAFDGDIPIGFLMIGFDVNSDDEGAPKIAKGNYNIWRFMIDKKFQGKGFGKKAMDLALEFVNTFPCGTAKYCWLSYESDNDVARQF